MRCSSCGYENPVSARCCTECGTRLESHCPHCGYESRFGARYCSECGASLAGAPALPVRSPIQYTPQNLVERIRFEQAALTARVGGAEGERKTITMLFADLADSTALIHDIDAEDARSLIDSVLDLMMEAVHHYEGYVAKSLGDGILALFGAPIACEDHAQRALYAALRMQEAMREYAESMRQEKGVHLLTGLNITMTGGAEAIIRSFIWNPWHSWRPASFLRHCWAMGLNSWPWHASFWIGLRVIHFS